VIEAAAAFETTVKRPLAGMAEGRMAEVVSERQCLREVLIEAERPCQRPRDLRDFKRVGEPRPKMVAFVKYEDLSFVRKTPESGRMNDAIAIATECAASGAGSLGMKPAAALSRIGRVWGTRAQCCNNHSRPPLMAWTRLTRAPGVLNYPCSDPAIK
jgi:hypothetical protein